MNLDLLRISGSTKYEKNALNLLFSGCFVEFETDSTFVDIELLTDNPVRAESELLARAAVFVDCEKKVDKMLTEVSTSIHIDLDTSVSKHIIRIEKLSEAAFGSVLIKEICISDNSGMTPTTAPTRKIEFIGDSITCGYGNEASCETDTFKTCEENPEAAYAILTANNCSAEYNLISWSGIGIITNWVPEDVNEPLEEILMPTLYEQRNKDYNPDLVIINLGTNDDSYTRKIEDRVNYFGGKYGLFLEQVHAARPDSAIICILGIMGRNLCEEEAKQVALFKEKHPDVKIAFLDMPEQVAAEDGIGADFHPSQKTHKKAAERLTSYVLDFMGW